MSKRKRGLKKRDKKERISRNGENQRTDIRYAKVYLAENSLTQDIVEAA